MLNSLDEELHWAVLHYAVDRNNMELCSILTDKKGTYRYGMLSSSENVLRSLPAKKTLQMSTSIRAVVRTYSIFCLNRRTYGPT